MAFDTGKGNDDVKAEINIIPLVDIMLVLLIIFMVAAPMMNNTIDISLPKAKADASDANQETVVLKVDKSESIKIGNVPLKREEVVPKLTQIFANREKKEILVAADEKVTHGFVISLMADIRRAGVYRISFETDPNYR